MAEGGVMGAIGVIANAVSDALAPHGVTIERLPLTPQSICALLQEAATSPAKRTQL